MNKWSWTTPGVMMAGILVASGHCLAAYDSGGTGADGAFNPTASQSIQLPPDGVFNYTNVNIPAGVVITYKRNASNTPVVIIASGDVTIAGTLDVSAKLPADVNDIGAPGVGGPGGFDGGRGGNPGGDASAWVSGYLNPNVGTAGVGPGGGAPGRVYLPSVWNMPAVTAGGGGMYGTSPNPPSGYCQTKPGSTYGNSTLLPLIGGSGGGGGGGGSTNSGWGGGGGGGAILIAASGTIDVTGSLLANGGVPPWSAANGRGTQGGGGSGGAIRLIATRISGNGAISAAGGSYGGESAYINSGRTYRVCSNETGGLQSGGVGRIRLEYETLARTAATNPLYLGGPPSITAVPGLPTLSITSVGGLPVPPTPTGSGDVSLPPATPNPVTVVLTTKGVTVGSSIKLTVLPAIGTAITATSAPTTGTSDNATASVDVNLPTGQSILQASVTYTVVAAVGDAMSVYAQGERVEQVRLSATLGGPSMATLITVSGREIEVPAEALAGMQG